MNTGVYAVYGPDKHVYVGSTGRTFKIRFAEHKQNLNADNHRCRYLQFAWNKHGENAFTFIAVAQIPADEKQLEAAETAVINWHKENGYIVYNSAPVAGSTLGYRFTEEQRAVLREKRVGRKPALGMIMSDEHKAAIGKANVGKVRSVEHREAIRAAHLGKPRSDEHKYNLSISAIGRTHTEETKQKVKTTFQLRKDKGLNVGRPCNTNATIDGVTLTLSEWCVKLDLKLNTVQTRIRQWGYTPEQALLTSVSKSSSNRRVK